MVTIHIDNLALHLRPYVLHVNRRKSHSNSTSIFDRLFSYLYSCSIFAGFPSQYFGFPFFVFAALPL